MKYLVLLFSITLAWQVNAAVLINELMYDPIGTDANHEWIELVNNGTEPIDTTGWKLFEANSNHGLTATRGGFVIAPNSFIVIADSGAQFIIDNPSYTGSVLDSTFSLNNTGETLEIRNNSLETQDTLTYSSSMGASENGASLSRTSSSNWIEANATAGVANNEDPYSSGSGGNQNTGSGGGNTGGSGSSGNSPGLNTKPSEVPKVKDFKPFYRGSLSKDLETVTVSTPVTFDFVVEKITPKETLQIATGITYISFGDGTKMVLPKIKPIVHEWQKAGTYTLVATYKTSNLLVKPLVTIKQTITVIDPPVALSVDEQNRITLKNEGEEAINISNWYITQGLHDAQIPPETFLEKGAELTLSDILVLYEGGSLELLTSSGISVVDYIPEQVTSNSEPEHKKEILTISEKSIVKEVSVVGKKQQPVDFLAVVSLLILLVTYSVSRVVLLGSPLSFSFASASEREVILEEIKGKSFFS